MPDRSIKQEKLSNIADLGDFRAFDLGKIAEDLRSVGLMPELRRAIEHAIDANSALWDLKAAGEAVVCLADLPAVRADVREQDVPSMLWQSLIAYAIILYARATKTKHKGRRETFDVTPEFSEIEKSAHREICDLRDMAVAHFGTGASYKGGFWVRETAIAILGDTGVGFAIASMRIAGEPDLVARLSSQIAQATSLMESVCDQKIARLSALFHEAAKSSPSIIGPLLVRYPFKSADFLCSNSTATEFDAVILQASREGKSNGGGRVLHRPNYDPWLGERNREKP